MSPRILYHRLQLREILKEFHQQMNYLKFYQQNFSPFKVRLKSKKKKHFPSTPRDFSPRRSDSPSTPPNPDFCLNYPREDDSPVQRELVSGISCLHVQTHAQAYCKTNDFWGGGGVGGGLREPLND